MLKLLVTAASSNSGKTAVTCGLLSLLRRQGYDPCAFKCGPDYIDPMFHRSVLGIPSDNLDVFLAGEEGIRRVFARGCQGHDAAVCEGVMGYYDGMTEGPAGDGRPSQTAGSMSGQKRHGETASPYTGARASAWHVASLLELPAILVLRPKGAALTLAAVIKGMKDFRRPSRICGVIFNDCSEMYYRMYAPGIEAEAGIPVLGYLPHMEEAVFESRHLGLMTAGEIRDLAERIDRIGARMEETIDLQRLVRICQEAGPDSDVKAGPAPGAGDAAGRPGAERVAGNEKSKAEGTGPAPGVLKGGTIPADPHRTGEAGYDRPAAGNAPVRIAVARDPAFNFIYAASLAAMEEAGAEICCFSPLADRVLPEGIGGLYLPGGYPELYGRTLAENEDMRTAIREAVLGGLPTIAECGGFLYLGQSLADADGQIWPMAGVLPGHGEGKGRLVRFGYGRIGIEKDSMLFRAGEQVPVHEFHYWDTTAQGSDLTLTKQSNGRQWAFGYATETMYAGFPHLYLAGTCASAEDAEPSEHGGSEENHIINAAPATLAGRFAEAACRYLAGRDKTED